MIAATCLELSLPDELMNHLHRPVAACLPLD